MHQVLEFDRSKVKSKKELEPKMGGHARYFKHQLKIFFLQFFFAISTFD